MLSLYHCAGTRSLRSLWLLLELSTPFTLIEMPFDLEALRSPAFRAVHPLGRVPCIVADEVTLFESGAIAQYLCERDAASPLGRPAGHPERPAWLQWVHFAETMATPLSTLVQHDRFLAPAERSPAVQDLEARRLGKTIGVVDRALGERPWLLSGFSAADIGIAATLHLAAPWVDLAQWPNALAHLARMEAREAFRAAIGRAPLPPQVSKVVPA